MIIFAGLGNPGSKYARNRHNIGFMAVEEIAHRHGFSPWRNRFKGEVSEGRLGGEKVLLDHQPEKFLGQIFGILRRVPATADVCVDRRPVKLAEFFQGGARLAVRSGLENEAPARGVEGELRARVTRWLSLAGRGGHR